MEPALKINPAPTIFADMPRYRSHKIVGALKIVSLHDMMSGVELSFETPFGSIVRPFAMFSRYRPVPGDYLVRYEDGYESISPAKAFEDGYSSLGVSAAPNAGIAGTSALANIDAFVIATARVTHEVNRGYCVSIGDTSQLPWDDAPTWQRESAIAGVRFILENPGAGPDASHNSWMGQKLRDGWKYGPVKDEARKLHPCMVEFADLPDNQKAKDYLFGSVVRSLAGIPATY